MSDPVMYLVQNTPYSIQEAHQALALTGATSPREVEAVILLACKGVRLDLLREHMPQALVQINFQSA